MIAVDVEGEAREVVLKGRPRGRGRRLSDAQARRYRDLIAGWLMDSLGLSRLDAHAVLCSDVSPRWLARRVEEIPPALRSSFARLQSEIARDAG
jgi:hypothetical protein